MLSNIKKVVQGSFHQGNDRFGETAGRQCTCCALFSVAFTLVKSPGHWVSKDLDFIIENGDLIYKSLNVNRYLMANELPRELTLLGSNVRINFIKEKCGIVNGNSPYQYFLIRNMLSNSSGLLFFMKGLCVSVVWASNHYFLFDSHSRNENGEWCSNGSSILLKFQTRNCFK